MRLTMWSRRRFLESASALPLIGGWLGLREAGVAGATAAAARDYFAELGVRPFINAAGTYTAMTSSLMPPEVVAAIEYAAKHYVMLDELHDKVGARLATLLRCEGVMVTSGAASALTLGTAAVLTGTDQQKIIDLPNLPGPRREVIVQKTHRFGYDHAVRNCGVDLVEVETRDELERAINERTAMMLFYNANNFVGRIRDEEFAQLGKKHRIPTLNDCAADVPPVENLWRYTGMGFESRGLLGRQGHSRTAECGAAPRPQRPHRRGPSQRTAELQFDRPRPQGQQGRDARHVRRRGAVSRARSRARPPRIRCARGDDPEGRHRGGWREGRGLRARGRQPRASRPGLVGRTDLRADAVVRALRSGEPSIGTRAEGETVVIGVWMMQPGDDKIVARRLRQVLERKG